MTDTSFVNISLKYDGDPFVFWEILKNMRAQAEKDHVVFDCGEITTISHEVP